jgi:NADH-quinone oxidoreductase subunit E/NADP-reducing hydrogenase subunit HndA
LQLERRESMAQVAVLSPTLREEASQIIESYRGQPGGLIQVLSRLQEKLGYLPRDVLKEVADTLGVSLTDVYGVVTFYALFTLKPRGRHTINLCKGTACYVRGAAQLIERLRKDYGLKPGDTTDDGRFTLEVIRCLGACGLGPALMIDRDVHARVKPEKLGAILSRYE